MLTFPYEVQDHDRLRGLSLAIHTLKQLTNNQYADIIDIASKYDHDENYNFGNRIFKGYRMVITR